MKHLETLRGSGTVTSNNGERVPVQYELNVYQKIIPAGNLQDPNATIPGLKRYEGTVLPVHFHGEILLLEMKDGRKLKFFYTNGEGSIALNQWIG